MKSFRNDDLTPVIDYGGWWAKRDDLACVTGDEYPSGSKVRQYHKMALAAPGAPMVVGCSADSAMQIYVAAAAKQFGVPGVVFTAARAVPTAATQYARSMGACVHEVRPGYLSKCRSGARNYCKALGAVVRWDVAGAVADATRQCRNIPTGVRRIIVPTGSGLTCAGVLIGLANLGLRIPVVAVAVSTLATQAKIMQTVARFWGDRPVPKLTVVHAGGKYGDWVAAVLPDGSALDPYYAAKALVYTGPGGCLWVPGMRPRAAIPDVCLREIDRLNAISRANGGDAGREKGVRVLP